MVYFLATPAVRVGFSVSMMMHRHHCRHHHRRHHHHHRHPHPHLHRHHHPHHVIIIGIMMVTISIIISISIIILIVVISIIVLCPITCQSPFTPDRVSPPNRRASTSVVCERSSPQTRAVAQSEADNSSVQMYCCAHSWSPWPHSYSGERQ
jgi:hypothetical protein